MRSTKVVISDRNDITRKGVEAIIGDSGEPYQVVAVFASLREAEDYLTEYAAHILILDDQTLTPMEVIRLVTRCHESRPGLGIIVMSQRRDGEYIQRVMRWGNASFLLKTGRLQEHLLKALQFNSSHYPFISPEALKLLGTRPMGTLTHRDRDVLRLLEQELQVKEIGERLGITAKTVYRIRDKLKKLLNVGNTDSLVDAARKQGLLDRKD
jgi:two-component system uhpT operon response regulator UhpA